MMTKVELRIEVKWNYPKSVMYTGLGGAVYMPIFEPPFCPNPECTYNSLDHSHKHTRWWILRGFYKSKSRGYVQRYRCRNCRKSFSERIFHTDYYAKRIDIDLKDLLFHYCNGFSQRALADHYHCTIRTIAHKLQIISRQAIAAILQANNLIRSNEDIAIDGMQNFTGSQYQPNNYTIAVGQYSQYISMVTQVIFRRSGKMNAYQKRQRSLYDQIGLWKRGAFSKSIKELVAHLAFIALHRSPKKQVFTCNSDRLLIYARQLQLNPTIKYLMSTGHFIHNITSSRKWRDLKNPLFPVNYIDSRLRNDLADWQRETTSFPREANRNFQRFLCYVAYHNFFKPHRSRTPHITHAEQAGLSSKDLANIRKSFYTNRAFYSQLKLKGQWESCWFCRLVTPLQVKNKIPYNGNRVPAYLHL